MTHEFFADCRTSPPALLRWPYQEAAGRALADVLAVPFDLARAQYGSAVELGLARRSMLDGRAFEQALAALERLILGSLARRV